MLTHFLAKTSSRVTKIGKGQKPEPTSGTKFSEPKFTIIKTVL